MVYAEVASILYSANKIIFGPGDLHALRSLSPRALSSITDLEIILNITGHYPRISQNLNKSIGRYRNLIDVWHITALHVKKHVNFSNLQLQLACDVQDLETGTRVLETLFNLS